MIIKSHYIFDATRKTTFSGYLRLENGQITEIGNLDNLPTNEKILDYSENMIVPGFIDAHVHFSLSALVHAGKLSPIDGKSENEVADKAADLPVINGWKLGIGWYASDFGANIYPSAAYLDKVCPDLPVMLIAGDAHTIWLNSKAMESLNISVENIPQGISGQAMTENGRLTGCFLEAVAIHYLSKALEIFRKDSDTDYLAYMKSLNQMGVTSIADVALTGEAEDDFVYPERFQHVEKEATVRTSFYPAMRENISPLQKLYQLYQSDKVQMGGVKQFFDGVTSTHTAYLKAEYEQPYFSGDFGAPLLPVEQMKALIFLANQHDLPIRIHVIGDQAIHLALKYYQESLTKFPLSSGKFNTLEHLEVMDFDDLPLINQEQLVLSIQPSHLLVGYESLDEEVGAKRAKEMFPFQEFIKNSGKLAFGTDSPVVIDVTPLESIYYAVARREKSGLPKAGLMPDQVMTVADSLIAHTSGAAKALSRSDIGDIEVGKKADLCILSRNILDISPEELLKTDVLATIFDGKVVYQK